MGVRVQERYGNAAVGHRLAPRRPRYVAARTTTFVLKVGSRGYWRANHRASLLAQGRGALPAAVMDIAGMGYVEQDRVSALQSVSLERQEHVVVLLVLVPDVLPLGRLGYRMDGI